MAGEDVDDGDDATKALGATGDHVLARVIYMVTSAGIAMPMAAAITLNFALCATCAARGTACSTIGDPGATVPPPAAVGIGIAFVT